MGWGVGGFEAPAQGRGGEPGWWWVVVGGANVLAAAGKSAMAVSAMPASSMPALAMTVSDGYGHTSGDCIGDAYVGETPNLSYDCVGDDNISDDHDGHDYIGDDGIGDAQVIEDRRGCVATLRPLQLMSEHS